MLINLIKTGIIHKRSLLLIYYKIIGLNENQVLIILLIMQLSNDDRKFITARELSEYMTLTTEKIDEEILKLVKLKLIKIENNKGKSVINLFPLFNQLAIICENSISDSEDEIDVVQIIKDRFQIPMTNEQSDSLKKNLEKNISIPSLIDLIAVNNVHDFESLEKIIKTNLKSKPKALTKYNWLID
ncbi:putative dnad-like replication protein [Spiroplasma sabaudiense Ar-1343]|uniref:Putative dnad-like replication protein n=1 Tax=Spiroplasma sabaudiense Ar-1343 TaxID=1276257 RepID=W6A954_9MOLU|nr:DnaD family protein [Spiroplasma sabaudiense]AHI53668.1 putative dnad-like replication protein [Spiroplasma sabaudiense Ar-1343]